jgi:hypothetical protein
VPEGVGVSEYRQVFAQQKRKILKIMARKSECENKGNQKRKKFIMVMLKLVQSMHRLNGRYLERKQKRMKAKAQ